MAGCETDNPGGNGGYGGNTGSGDNTGAEWLIPTSEVFDGGPGKDGIPALTEPEKIPLESSDNRYLGDDDLVLGFQSGDEILAYPHAILDWHEIINDRLGELELAITYCPLTGTGIAWNRKIGNEVTTFGVSGLLYQSNLIPYDRITGSNWSQIGGVCVNGELIGRIPQAHQGIEMPWGRWKQLFPGSQVVSKFTGYPRTYGFYPYGDYRSSQRLIFPTSSYDDRLHSKERVLGVIHQNHARVYRFESFDTSLTVIHDNFGGLELVVLGRNPDYMTAFIRVLPDGTLLEFSPQSGEDLFTDQEGNVWNLFGLAIGGPRIGQQLIPAKGFMGYWFSFAAFYPQASIFE